MNIEILRTLIVAAELQNFHAVSRRMHMSQPAIAKRIRVLEEALNSKLFVRSGKRMLLTKDGRLALTQAKRIIRDFDQMHENMRSRVDFKTIRLGAVDTILSTWLSDFLEKHRAIYPDVRFEISVAPTQNLIEDLGHSRIEIGFVLGPSEDRPFVDIPLGQMDVGLFCGPKTRNTLKTEKRIGRWLSEQTIVTFPRNSKPHIRLIEFLKKLNLPKLPIITNCASILTMQSMAERDIGVATLPKPTVKDAGLYELRFGADLPNLSFSATYDPAMATSVITDACRVAAEVAHDFNKREASIT